MAEIKEYTDLVKNYKDLKSGGIVFIVILLPLIVWAGLKSLNNGFNIWWTILFIGLILFLLLFIKMIKVGSKNYKVVSKGVKFHNAGLYLNAARLLKIAFDKDQTDAKISDFYANYINKYNIKDLDISLPSAGTEKIDEIFNQNENKLLHHIEILLEAETKKQEAADKKQKVHEELKDDMENLESRYDKILELERKKINFYKKIQDDILVFKKKKLEYLKFKEQSKQIKEMQKDLEHLENEVIKDSVKEEYTEDTKDILEQEKALLEAVEYYGKQVDIVDNMDLFSDLNVEWDVKLKSAK